MSTPLRVLHLTPTYPTEVRPSSGVFIKQQVDALCELGIEVTVVVVKQYLPDRLAKLLPHYHYLIGTEENEQTGNPTILYTRYLHIPRYFGMRLTIASCASSIERALNRLPGQRWDVVHAHDSYVAGMAGDIVKRKLGIHGLMQLHTVGNHMLSHPFRSRIHRKTLEHYEVVTAVGSSLKRGLSDVYGALADKVKITRYGVDIHDTTRRQAGTRYLTRIVAICSLVPRKAVTYTLNALARLMQEGFKDWSYRVIGDGYQRPQLEKLVEMLELGDKVEFLGRMSHSEAMNYLAESDLFVMPSWDEAFGLAYVEAMALGIPAIGCINEGAQDIITNEHDGLLVVPRSLDSLTDALRLCLSNPNQLKRWGENAAQTALQYTWENNAKTYQALYKSLMPNSGEY